MSEGAYASSCGGEPAARTSIRTVVWANPASFPAVTVYVRVADATLGVPEIAPVVELRRRPGGSAGSTAQLVTVPSTEARSASRGMPSSARISARS